jgi:hypothetical protein
MSKPGGDPSSGISLGDALRRPKRHPACRQREARPGCRMERENLAGDAKGKGASGSNREAESTDAPDRADCLLVALKRSEGGGSSPLDRVNRCRTTGIGRNPKFNGRRQPSRGGTSRMTRECQVRIWCSEASCHSSGCKSRQHKESSPCCSDTQRQGG